jgi:sulfonate transport system ATP-binding protein
VLVLDGGRFRCDRRIELDHPRDRTDPAFATLRGELLEALGVEAIAV